MAIQGPGFIEPIGASRDSTDSGKRESEREQRHLGRLWRLQPRSEDRPAEQIADHLIEKVTEIPQPRKQVQNETPSFLKGVGEWARSVFRLLSLEEKICQLFFVVTFLPNDVPSTQRLCNILKQYKLGGFFFINVPQTDFRDHARSIQSLQQAASIPLLIGTEGLIGFPKNGTLGAIQDKKLLQETGKLAGMWCRQLGIHIQCIPVVDVHHALASQVSAEDFFADYKAEAVERSVKIMTGLQEARVIVMPQAFPKHAYDEESEEGERRLSRIFHPMARFDNQQLYPFRVLAQQHVQSILFPHLYLPLLDSTCKDISTSKSLIYAGMVDRYGHDPQLMLDINSIPQAIEWVKQAIRRRRLSEEDLNERVLRLLQIKEWLGLGIAQPTLPQSVMLQATAIKESAKEKTRQKIATFRRSLYQKAITLVRDEKQLLPLSSTGFKKIGLLQIEQEADTPFEAALKQSFPLETVKIWGSQLVRPGAFEAVIESLQDWPICIVTLYLSNKAPDGLSPGIIELLNRMRASGKPTIFVLFGSPQWLPCFHQASTLILAHEEDVDAQAAAVQLLIGKISYSTL
jgi:beta-N-acetylhexosaminidase